MPPPVHCAPLSSMDTTRAASLISRDVMGQTAFLNIRRCVNYCLLYHRRVVKSLWQTLPLAGRLMHVSLPGKRTIVVYFRCRLFVWSMCAPRGVQTEISLLITGGKASMDPKKTAVVLIEYQNDFILRSRGITTIALGGFLTNCCVESTMRTG